MSVPRETTETPSVSRETSERLASFIKHLMRWNSRINLVAAGDVPNLWQRHVQDCLQLAPLIPGGVLNAIDLGSGAGFPGLILAIATGLPFTLIEADARKAAFLREAIRLTDASATVINQRIEAAKLGKAPLLTARALAPLDTLIGLAEPFLAAGGTLLFPKGANVEAEIAMAERRWTMRVERHISQTGGGGVILRISEVQRA